MIKLSILFLETKVIVFMLIMTLLFHIAIILDTFALGKEFNRDYC